MFYVEMLPADHGDCLLLTYGEQGKAPHRILIDGGTAATFPRLRRRLEALPPGQRHFELLIVTHIDSDHIDGVLKLLDLQPPVSFGDIWFNGWQHLVPPRSRKLGPRQGDILGNLLSQRYKLPWNKAFGGRTVVVPDTGPLPTHKLESGMRLTLLSPTWKELDQLDSQWINESFRQGRFPGEAPLTLGQRRNQLAELSHSLFAGDTAPANGSSIAVLAEYGGKCCLLTGDAFAPTLVSSLQRLGPRPLKVDAFKLPHHGSRANVSPELLESLQCSHYLVSTSGAHFNHPDTEALQLILQHGLHKAKAPVRFHFNYEVPTTRGWRHHKPADAQADLYKTPAYPTEEEGGLSIDLFNL